jgi:hypothetical protein
MRIVDRLLSVVIALVMVVVGLVVAVEVGHTLLGQPGYLVVPWQDAAAWMHGQAWNDPVVRAVGIGLTVLGLALLLAELSVRRPALLVLRPRTEGITCAVSRRGLDRAIAARADEVDGVRRATTRVYRRRAAVTAVTALRDPGDLQSRVETATTEWVGRLGLVRPPAVRVRVKKKESS